MDLASLAIIAYERDLLSKVEAREVVLNALGVAPQPVLTKCGCNPCCPVYYDAEGNAAPRDEVLS